MRQWVMEKLRTLVYDPRDKLQVQQSHIQYMLARTQQIFRYDGLPDSIPQRILELYLQINGHLCFHEWKDNLYVYTGGLGGEPDVYYQPTIYTVSNPAQGWSDNLKIDIDCVVMKNDSLYLGLLPLFNRYAYHMAENELSMLVADINSRMVSLISASDDRTLASARQYLSEIESGKIGVIAENAFLEGLKTQPYTGTSGARYLTDLIEYEQYLKASWYNEIGLNANYNMKREHLSTSESQMNNDALAPLIDDMLSCRRYALDKVNAMYGTNITVSLESAWEDNEIQTEIVTELLQEEIESKGELSPKEEDRGEVLPDETTL